MRLLLALLLTASPAFSQTIKFSHEGQTNMVKMTDDVLVNCLVSGTNYVTCRTTVSNLLSLATNSVRLAAGSSITITTNNTAGGITYTIASSGGGGLPSTAPVWTRFSTNASYTLSTNFYVHEWTALSVAGTITLPSAAGCSNLHLIIKDTGGNCSATNVTIAVQSGDRIDGLTTNSLSNNYAGKQVYSAGGTNWYVY